jgi:hypothetical membrane protein
MTRAFLICGLIAGPVYLVVGVIQAFTRPGFDITRDDLSLLANGNLGWVQIANLVLTGVFVALFAVGLWQSWRNGLGGFGDRSCSAFMVQD